MTGVDLRLKFKPVVIRNARRRARIGGPDDLSLGPFLFLILSNFPCLVRIFSFTVSFMQKVVVLIDGGNLRVLARRAGYQYNPDYIEKLAHACVESSETLLRALYYDCPPYNGKVRLPVSGNQKEFTGSDAWLRQLARKDIFAVREGVLKFRGYKPARVPITPAAPLSDADFEPIFEQKGVDMRIGLDIATFSDNRMVERIILVSGDTDCIPAMKYGRKAGLQIVLVRFPNAHIAPELLEHADFERRVAWPAP